MKTLLVSLTIATAAISTARAEYYRPSVVRDTTVVGAVAGALIGGHNGDRWAQGALIGAAAGAIVGTVVDRPRPVVRERVIQPVQVVPCAPVVGTTTVVTTQAPRVVYVETYTRPVVIRRPVIHVAIGGNRGHYGHHRHHGHHRHGHRR